MSDSPTQLASLGAPLDFLRRIWRMNQSFEKLSVRMERRLGVTAQQRLVIRCVGKYPGITSGQLADLLHVDPGTVSSTSNRLEAKGLLEKRRDLRDRRRTFLHLTASGQALDKPADGTVEAVVSQLLAAAPAEDVEAMKRLVSGLTALLSDEAPSPMPARRSPSRARR